MNSGSTALCPLLSAMKSCIFAGLKRFLSISLLSIFLVSTSELYQLVKLPLLVDHFKAHKLEDPSMTLWKFLAMHYDYTATPDEDHAQDMKLPFKANDNFIHSTIADFEYNPFITPLIKTFSSYNEPFTYYEEMFVSSSFLSNIWQPPKSC